jgi:demethylmenaquinone methyltransferase / 2-methoxy-6-polyprenyl-1,4-benzoquinol methylase
VTRATLAKRPDDIARMFDAVAEHYDRTNAVMTFGQERRWRRLVADALDIAPGARVLDLAAGTGASSLPFAQAGASAVACDFSLGMLAVGRRKHREVSFVAGDALRLPFRDGAFDAVTISFGLRNVADVPTALAELARVTKPSGRLAVLETSHPPSKVLARLNRTYVERVMLIVARPFSSDPAAYGYLAESARAWLDQTALADAMRDAGWGQVGWRNLLFGAVALHVAQRPR